MKIEKMLIFAIMVCSLLVTSSISVDAADETKMMVDAEDDVLDVITGETSDDYPNIDITELTYSREGTRVTLTVTVKGEIENLGDLEGTELSDIVTYGFTLTTSFDMYFIIYINNECVLYSNYMEENITEENFTVDGATLEVNFDINNTDDETYESLSSDSVYMAIGISEEDTIYVTDTVGDQPLEVYALATNLGEAGKEVEFMGIAEYGQSPYTYHWDFDDGSTSTEKSPTHIYDKAGTYEYNFTVIDDSGSSQSYADEIIISGEENGDEDSNPIIIFIAVIVIIAVVGVIILVYIIRR